MKNSIWQVLVVIALVLHAYILMNLTTKVDQLEEVVQLITEVSSEHTKLLTNHKKVDCHQ